jgi:hypothetical protein
LPAEVVRDTNSLEARRKLRQFCKNLSDNFPQMNVKGLLKHTLLKECSYRDRNNTLQLNADGWLAYLTLTAHARQTGTTPPLPAETSPSASVGTAAPAGSTTASSTAAARTITPPTTAGAAPTTVAGTSPSAAGATTPPTTTEAAPSSAAVGTVASAGSAAAPTTVAAVTTTTPPTTGAAPSSAAVGTAVSAGGTTAPPQQTKFNFYFINHQKQGQMSSTETASSEATDDDE